MKKFLFLLGAGIAVGLIAYYFVDQVKLTYGLIGGIILGLSLGWIFRRRGY